MLEVFNTLNYLNPSNLLDLFNVKQVEYNLKTKNLVMLPQIMTQTYGTNSIKFRDIILWNALTDDMKACTNVAALEKKVIRWKGESCNCKSCRSRVVFCYPFFFSHEYFSNLSWI